LPERKSEEWEFATLSFPDSLTFGAQLHPSSGCWLSVPRRCVDLAWTLASRSGPAAEPSAVSPPTDCWARLLGSDLSHLPARRFPNRRLDAPEMFACSLRSPGDGIEVLVVVLRSLAPGHGSCLLSLKLPFGLSSDDPRGTSRWFGSYGCPPGSSPGLPTPSLRSAQSVMARFPFLLPVATPVGFSGPDFVHRRRIPRSTTLAHSCNFAVSRPTVFASPIRNPWMGEA
jgi:hypothetical protein